MNFLGNVTQLFTALGLTALAKQAPSSVAITGGSLAGVTVDATTLSASGLTNLSTFNATNLAYNAQQLYLTHQYASMEIGSTTVAGTPYLDFHSSGSTNDYDVRMIVSGGTPGTSGTGTLQLYGTLSGGAAAFSGQVTANAGIALAGQSITGLPGGVSLGAGTIGWISNANDLVAATPQTKANGTFYVTDNTRVAGSGNLNAGASTLASLSVTGTTSVSGTSSLAGINLTLGNIYGSSTGFQYTISGGPSYDGGFIEFYGSTTASAGLLNLGGTRITLSAPTAVNNTLTSTSTIQGSSLRVTGSSLYSNGSLYSDPNWGMIIRAYQASPVTADFEFQNSAGTSRLRIDPSGNATFYNGLTVNAGITALGSIVSNGNITSASTLYLTNGNIKGSGSYGTYGALTIGGQKNGWAGVNFNSGDGATNLGTFMVLASDASQSGFYAHDTGWHWQWINGVLAIGTVPAANVSAGTFSGSYAFTGSVSVNSGGAQFLAPGYMHYSDVNDFYILLTGSGAPTAGFNGLRPFRIHLADGSVHMDNGVTTITQAATDNSTNVATTAMVQAAIANVAKSLATSGYTKLPGGLIIQWGTVTGTSTWTFPIAFPTACVYVGATPSVSDGGKVFSDTVSSITTSNAFVTTTYTTGTAATVISSQSSLCFAIGY